MSVPISNAQVSVKSVILGFSRYQKSTVVNYGNLNEITFNIYNRQPYQKTGKEKVMLINKGVEYRPDLVSFDYYGIPDGWWKIMEVNGIYDIYDFKAGLTIFLPDSLF